MTMVVLINTSVLISDQRVEPAYEVNDERETNTVDRHTRSEASATTMREMQAAMRERDGQPRRLGAQTSNQGLNHSTGC